VCRPEFFRKPEFDTVDIGLLYKRNRACAFLGRRSWSISPVLRGGSFDTGAGGIEQNGIEQNYDGTNFHWCPFGRR
jgi:hypothetical protein